MLSAGRLLIVVVGTTQHPALGPPPPPYPPRITAAPQYQTNNAARGTGSFWDVRCVMVCLLWVVCGVWFFVRLVAYCYAYWER